MEKLKILSILMVELYLPINILMRGLILEEEKIKTELIGLKIRSKQL